DWFGAARSEYKSVGAPCTEPVLDQTLSQHGGDWHATGASSALRCDVDPRLRVVGASDGDRSRSEVHRFPVERHQLAAAQACVERGRPQRFLILWECGDQGGGFFP